jgi:hypothetical protein
MIEKGPWGQNPDVEKIDQQLKALQDIRNQLPKFAQSATYEVVTPPDSRPEMIFRETTGQTEYQEMKSALEQLVSYANKILAQQKAGELVFEAIDAKSEIKVSARNS